MAPVDPHSFTESTHPATTHIALKLYLDFPSSTIHASALFTLQTPHSGPFFLDTRSLTIHSALHLDTSTAIPFSLSPTTSDPIKGPLLTLTLSNHSSFLLTFSTSPSSSALQWLLPPQTLVTYFSDRPFFFQRKNSRSLIRKVEVFQLLLEYLSYSSGACLPPTAVLCLKELYLLLKQAQRPVYGTSGKQYPRGRNRVSLVDTYTMSVPTVSQSIINIIIDYSSYLISSFIKI